MSRKPKAQITPATAATKQSIVVELLRRPQGASIPEIVDATSWKAASARGFLSAVIQKRLGLPLLSEKSSDSERRYHVAVLKAPE
jgi:hypothetical protein